MAPKTPTANGSSSKSKGSKPATNGSATPTTEEVADSFKFTAPATSNRPDKAVYDAEQEKLKKEIESLQTKLAAVKEKIALAGKGGAGDDRRTKLRAELDEIRGQQANGKTSRGKIHDQLNVLNESIQKKIKDLNAAKSRTPFKTVAEVDAHIKNLEARVESGSMKITEEKKAIQEISQSKRARKTVESFQQEQEAIDASRAAADELRKQLDDPEVAAISQRYASIKAQLEELKKEADDAYSNRNKLFDERNALQAELDVLHNQRRESTKQYREANDRFYAKLAEDRARRAERARAERAAHEEEKKKALAEKLREEASIPAYQAEIEDCQTLIDQFSGKASSGTLSTSTPSSGVKSDIAGVPKLEIRQVEAPTEGLVVRKKKGEDEEAYFQGKGKRGKKGAKTATPTTEAPATGKLNVPMPTLHALFALAIPPPTSPDEVPRVIKDLKTKKAWFEANQARVTTENIAKAEAEVRRLLGTKAETEGVIIVDGELVPPAGNGEKPAEPAPTPSVADTKSTAVPGSEVADKLENVQEQEVDGSER
ncbi:hypothetical protein PUNSTDRAFT_64698 [Punctularia strigosozonata HHB-11173 SS5]|uniref:uncharacterized protein n=1 Tax=Punctularia strigosozonata (strain HHB-11173) TaxID=741275 RepID=UPI0004417F19|nr:uncharacterized protein PUNSTDRAFT_64698 [Punctularia strigosozonata HHB-11173 SS5]EIN10624.1 hypothetical protein PUNSTDRAFT_64698 [Punctularia strigosozonata HHB-11173 SS5]